MGEERERLARAVVAADGSTFGSDDAGLCASDARDDEGSLSHDRVNA